MCQKIEALQLAARFALPPNSLGYCGRDSAPERFKSCISNSDCAGVETEIEKFIVLHPYLKTISELTGKSKFSYDVIESYCIGNDLLVDLNKSLDNKVNKNGYDLLMDNFLEQGVPEWFVAELKDQKPKEFIPTHLFQVLYVGVGRASGSVPFNLETINNCMIRWGEVIDITGQQVQANLKSLEVVNNKYKLVNKEAQAMYNSQITPNLVKGDLVAVHWKQVIIKPSSNQLEKLVYWTEKVIESIVPEYLED